VIARACSRGGLTAALAAVAVAVPAAAADGAAGEARPFTLSEPGTLSRWAFVERATVARARPDRSSRAVARLSTRTPEGTAGLVLALERVEVEGRLWVRVRLPMLPNNTTGWVPRDRLGAYNAVRTHLIVDTRRLRARLVRGGRTVFRSVVGVGQGRWPTPKGRFFIRNRLKGFTNPIYGPLAFGTSARSAVLTDWPAGGFIGIHGTNQPGLLPGRVSHGCIRMRNADILRLARRMPVGTPLTIR
jgi:lipoprotein-anchoring transpeptidase ErfK/SrfK